MSREAKDSNALLNIAAFEMKLTLLVTLLKKIIIIILMKFRIIISVENSWGCFIFFFFYLLWKPSLFD